MSAHAQQRGLKAPSPEPNSLEDVVGEGQE